MQPKVSIQIPNYNQQRFLKKTIESCLMQDYANIEINIADDHSTDDTARLVKPFLQDERIRYFKNETNIGRVANYRKALYEYATGEWVINLDGDDYFTDKSFISRAIEMITGARDEKIVLYQANNNITRIHEVLPASERINEELLLVNGTDYFLNYYKVLNFFHCATLYKRSEAIKLNFYTYNCLFTDFNSIAKLFINSGLLLSSNKVAVWYQHDVNESATLDGEKLNDELGAIDELAHFAQGRLPAKSVVKWRRKMKVYILSNYFNMQETAKQKRIALKYLLRNFIVDRLFFRQLIKAILGSVGIK
jgi:glycosyltransferase involved in cell wall biosynthesis